LAVAKNPHYVNWKTIDYRTIYFCLFTVSVIETSLWKNSPWFEKNPWNIIVSKIHRRYD